ncbi:mechanosensitive ion channel family protein [Solitalea canadensis]|uniref:Small-conductance mechanosensitive channel n=1 Tax=Solitalea canadensis (strain ATCC 29591 / DSM 3403 / JCM 21819 / LMG 8368 / NBRC 15130 / NCIMB 12057 / USAM 9D) TaxID=929556 RepID=H8KLL2_SOLCM|nr:mechanosensitive ion channel family protein [Solitalea canadensis]AFD08899.1 small-conductance mechanosensitive channel [Solitalea canadensis DSM 3403]
MIILQFLDSVFWGNPLSNYIWLGGILFFGIIFKRIISKLLSKLLFRLFKQFSGDSAAGTFVDLMIRPIELLILFCAIYLAVNQLDHPLNKPVFNRAPRVTQTVKQEAPTNNNTAKKTVLTPTAAAANSLNEFNAKAKENIAPAESKSIVTYADIIDKLFLFLVLGTFFWMLLRIIDFIAFVLMNKATESESKAGLQLIPFTRELVKILIGSLGFFVIMSAVFNLNVGLIVSGLGIGGLALALAGKETVENLFGAFTIFIDKPFIVGDNVNVGGVEGTVEKVGFRSTRIRTNEKSLVSMPNKRIVDNPMDNLTEKSLRRVKFNLGLDYSTSPAQMKAITSEIDTYLKNTPNVADDITVAFDSFGESALNIVISYFIEMIPNTEYVKLKEEIAYKILAIVNTNKAEIAFPTRKVLHETIDGSSSPQITPVD